MTRTHRITDLLEGIAHVDAAQDVEVSGLAVDSRLVKPGDAFIALRGGSVHGLSHAADAIARGARCVLWEPPAELPRLDAPAIEVPGLRAHLGKISNQIHGAPSRELRVIGVTGTNGKTSIVHLVAQALMQQCERVATIGTLGSGFPDALVAGERTTPDVASVHARLAEFRDAGATHVAMEVSSHALDQQRVDGVHFDCAVFTNLTRDHLDYHLDMQAYGAAKARLFAMPGLRAAIVNSDDELGRSLLASLPASVMRLSYGVGEGCGADVRAEAVRRDGAHTRFRLVASSGIAAIESRLIGSFNVSNLLAVAATLLAIGWTLEATAAALRRLTPVPGRMQALDGDASLPLVVIDYAHTPDALEQALGSLREHTRGGLHVVFGCGGERDAGKRPLMARIAERCADRVTVTDDNPRGENGDHIAAAIFAGFRAPERVQLERDRARAIHAAIATAQDLDAVLIAGKGHEPYQEIGRVRRPFSDADIASQALDARLAARASAPAEQRA